MEFEGELAARIRALNGSLAPRLSAAIEYSLLAPGKRIRPRLVFAAGRALGLNEASLIPAACAVEAYHCFSLIHDDLPCLDNDDYRRGKPSCHKAHGEALALLAGDALLAASFELLADSAASFPAERVLEAIRWFSAATGARGVIGGQAAELALGAKASPAEIRAVHRGKTGALFVASVEIPRALAGGDAERVILRAFGEAIGEAFQAADDLADSAAAEGSKNLASRGSPREIAQTARGALIAARDAVARLFGPRAEALVSISGEVERALVAE